jgi:hypothetical protein
MFFLRKHGGHLALGGAVDVSVGPALFATIQVGLGFFQALEAQALQRRFLRVANAGFDFALAIGILDATRHGDRPIVGEYLAIERVERGIVDVGDEDALAEIVEHYDARGPAKAAEGALVQFGPDAGAGAESEQANRFATAAQRQDEQPRAAILAGLGIFWMH